MEVHDVKIFSKGLLLSIHNQHDVFLLICTTMCYVFANFCQNLPANPKILPILLTEIWRQIGNSIWQVHSISIIVKHFSYLNSCCSFVDVDVNASTGYLRTLTIIFGLMNSSDQLTSTTQTFQYYGWNRVYSSHKNFYTLKKQAPHSCTRPNHNLQGWPTWRLARPSRSSRRRWSGLSVHIIRPGTLSARPSLWEEIKDSLNAK